MNSPCKGICVLDTQHKYCVGCFRTIEEISIWYKLTLEQQNSIIEECKKREENYNAKC